LIRLIGLKMGTYAEEESADFESGLLPGETEGLLWIEKQKKFKGLERHQVDGALTLQEVWQWNSY
jgi:hypothetical protein